MYDVSDSVYVTDELEIMPSLRLKVLNLYKNLLFMGRDYPLGYEFFRTRCHKAFMKNAKETNPVQIKKMIMHGKYVMKELEALYYLKKYRTLKNRYYKEEDENTNEILKRINDMSKQ